MVSCGCGHSGCPAPLANHHTGEPDLYPERVNRLPPSTLVTGLCPYNAYGAWL